VAAQWPLHRLLAPKFADFELEAQTSEAREGQSGALILMRDDESQAHPVGTGAPAKAAIAAWPRKLT